MPAACARCWACGPQRTKEPLLGKRIHLAQNPWRTIYFERRHGRFYGHDEGDGNGLPRTGIAHLIRASVAFIPHKDRKALCALLKEIYGAADAVATE